MRTAKAISAEGIFQRRTFLPVARSAVPLLYLGLVAVIGGWMVRVPVVGAMSSLAEPSFRTQPRSAVPRAQHGRPAPQQFPGGNAGRHPQSRRWRWKHHAAALRAFAGNLRHADAASGLTMDIGRGGLPPLMTFCGGRRYMVVQGNLANGELRRASAHLALARPDTKAGSMDRPAGAGLRERSCRCSVAPASARGCPAEPAAAGRIELRGVTYRIQDRRTTCRSRIMCRPASAW